MRRKLVALTFVLTAACGHSGSQPAPDASAPVPDAAPVLLDSGLDSASAPHDGGTDARVDSGFDAALPVALDGATDAPAADAQPDASLATDAAADAPVDGAEAGPALVCPGGRNVFVANQSAVGGLMGNASSVTLTNLNSKFLAGNSPFFVSGDNGLFDISLQFQSNGDRFPDPGFYPATSSQAQDGGIFVNFSVGGSLCGATGGGATVVSDFPGDGGPGALTATFDITCGVSGVGSDEYTGCVRYVAEQGPADASVPPAEPGYDSGIVDTLDGSGGDDPLAPCLGHPLAFYVEGAALTSSPEMLTESIGNWQASSTSGTGLLLVQSTNMWALELGPSSGDILTAGTTYTDAGVLPMAPARFSLEANGVSCDSPNATFTIWDYADTGGDKAAITRLTASFTTACTNGAGPVQGCVRFTQ